MGKIKIKNTELEKQRNEDYISPADGYDDEWYDTQRHRTMIIITSNTRMLTSPGHKMAMSTRNLLPMWSPS